MSARSYQDIKNSLRQLYIEDERPWLVGYSGGKLYANASNGECPIQIDTSTPSCGNSRFGCWTCPVVERDKPSPTRHRSRMRQPSELRKLSGLAAGDERMEHLIAFRETLLFYQNPDNGKRDMRRKNGAEGPGPLHIEARRELLTQMVV